MIGSWKLSHIISSACEQCGEAWYHLAFDLIYCCNTYGYYHGLVAPVTGKTIKKTVKPGLTPEQIAEKEAETAARIQELEQELIDLEKSISEFEDISLDGVQVVSDKYGTGIVIDQKVNRITVRFPDIEKSFILDQKFTGRPRFEDDEEIVAAFTEYGRQQQRIEKIQGEMKRVRGTV